MYALLYYSIVTIFIGSWFIVAWRIIRLLKIVYRITGGNLFLSRKDMVKNLRGEVEFKKELRHVYIAIFAVAIFWIGTMAIMRVVFS